MKSVLVFGAVIFLGTALVASAAPLSPSLGPLAPGASVAGQATLCSSVVPACSDFIQVDWIVLNDPAAGPGGPYVYFYQLENTTASTTFIDTFGVTSGQWTLAGFLGGVDLDGAFASPFGTPVLGHSSANYATLGAPAPAESEPALAATISSPTSAVATATSADWVFTMGGGLADFVRKGEQSVVLWATSLSPPKYGNGFASDTVPPSPWVTTNTGSTLLPVPVPEPGFYGLLGIALSGIWLGVTRRRNGAASS